MNQRDERTNPDRPNAATSAGETRNRTPPRSPFGGSNQVGLQTWGDRFHPDRGRPRPTPDDIKAFDSKVAFSQSLLNILKSKFTKRSIPSYVLDDASAILDGLRKAIASFDLALADKLLDRLATDQDD